MKDKLKTAIRYALYPSLLLSVVLIIWGAINFNWDYKTVQGLTTFGLVITLITIETVFPLSKEWKMTRQSFFRDLKYILVDAAVISAAGAGFGFLAIYYSENYPGIFSGLPYLIGVVGYLLVFEFLQYWTHRYFHEGKGKLGRFFGDLHLAHHLPDKVYVVMHAVFNPINAFFTFIILQIPLIILGISPEAALTAILLINLQTFVSHFNVDVRAGFLNYIFIGTETHRYHHSADLQEAKNYGSTLSIWDIVFGTFYYQPNAAPKKLGVSNPEELPKSENLWQVISFPFRRLRAN